MNPRTEIEHKVVNANVKIKDINPQAINWAVNNLIIFPAFRMKNGTAYCGDCGKSFNHKDNSKNVICPHCGRKLEIEDTKKRTLKSGIYFSTLQIADGLQCQRVIRLETFFKKNNPFEIETNEVCRMWLNDKGKCAVTALKRAPMSYYWDSFICDSKIELRRMCDTYIKLSDTYIYPKFKLIPELKRNGIKNFNINVNPFQLMKGVLTDSRIETLVKSGNKKALCYFINNPKSLDNSWNSFKIATRKGYNIADMGLWCDTINMLLKLGKDINSPKYICPSNLKTEHDRWLQKVNLIENKKRELEKLQRAIEKEDEFINSKSCYFGIVISDDEIEISVLDTIAKYKEEGDSMHHCVFANDYYSKPNSIILCAHFSDGTRIETIEYSLTENKVIQCHGMNNIDTEHHNRIINLVNSNAHRFIEAKEKVA